MDLVLVGMDFNPSPTMPLPKSSEAAGQYAPQLPVALGEV